MSANTVFISIVGFLFFSSSVHAGAFDSCKSTADTVRQILPLRKDSFTVVKNVACLPGNPKNIFVYILEVSGAPENTIKKLDVTRDIKPDGLNQFCTDPNTRALLNAFDVDHRYYTERGIFIGSFLMKSQECKNR